MWKWNKKCRFSYIISKTYIHLLPTISIETKDYLYRADTLRICFHWLCFHLSWFWVKEFVVK